MSTKQPHSAELFVTTRDFWWNADFMELMARRWRLEAVRSVLDVGSGLGHWGRTLLPHFRAGVTIEGIDPEPRWVALASEMAAKAGMAPRLRYSQGSANQLPFVEDTFDMVTCQTVLVHIADVRRALREMIRVLKPGGLLAVAEPNNLVFSVLLGRTRSEEGLETTLALVRLQLTCERGKVALGEGNNSVGDLLPGYFNECGLRQIAVYQSDHATPLIPPYDDPEQRANRDELVDLARREIYIWNRADAERYFRAGGGDPSAFGALWATALEVSQAVAKGLLDGSEGQAGGSAFYLLSGRKPH
jgi:SAM-dependent methyltransferase